MDIQYLLWLQEFRNGAGAFLTDFMLKISTISEMVTSLAIVAVIYWCIDKKAGTYLLVGWNGNRLMNGFLKVTACIYRPWIRDARIIPDPKAMAAATGYSFPSGHSMNSTTLFGGMVIYRDTKKPLKIVMFILMLLVPFSRNFLGVHTPQDVIVGTIVGLLVMFGAMKLMDLLEKKPQADLWVALIFVAAAVAVAIFASVKPYPVDYDADGKILVDGAKMANDTFKGVGWMIGFFGGWLIERRFVKFTTDVSATTRVVRLVAGATGFYFLNTSFCPLIRNGIGGAVGTTLSSLVEMLYVVLLAPLLFRLFEGKTAVDKAAAE